MRRSAGGTDAATAPPICASGAAGSRSATRTASDVPVRYQYRRSSGAVRCGTNGRRQRLARALFFTAPLSPLVTHVENCRNFRAASAPNKASCSAAPILLGWGRRAPLCPLGRAGNGTAPGGRLPSPVSRLLWPVCRLKSVTAADGLSWGAGRPTVWLLIGSCCVYV